MSRLSVGLAAVLSARENRSWGYTRIQGPLANLYGEQAGRCVAGPMRSRRSI